MPLLKLRSFDLKYNISSFLLLPLLLWLLFMFSSTVKQQQFDERTFAQRHLRDQETLHVNASDLPMPPFSADVVCVLVALARNQ